MVTVSAVERAVPSVGVADGNAMEPPMESQMGRTGWENGARKVDNDDGGWRFLLEVWAGWDYICTEIQLQQQQPAASSQ